MGVDDLPAASFTTPGLTSIHHPLYDIGKKAFHHTLEIFRGTRNACHEKVSARLVVRESTAPAARR